MSQDAMSGNESLLEHMCHLQFDAATNLRRLTGLVCTIGSASQSVDMICKLLKAGMNIVRLNFSHDPHDFHDLTVKNVREACERVSEEQGYNRYIAFALDTKGPEIRTGLLENANEVELRRNENIRLSINKDLMDKGNRDCVFIDYPNIINVVQPGNLIYINDGQIILLVKEVAVDCVICQIEVGGMLGSRKGVNLPGIPVDLPPVSEKDRYDLKFGVDHNVDFIFASKIRHPSALKEIRSVLGERGKDIKIVAKMDSTQILNYLDDIIAAADGILIDRNDLSIEVPAEKLFLLQKAIIARCNRVGKPAICATQILESMRFKTRPSRAEVADLGNIVIDGADCVVLCSESAVGVDPIAATTCLDNICREAEAAIWHRNLYADLVANNPAMIDAAHAVALAAVDAAKKSMAAVILVLTNSGRSAHLVSKYRPRCPIVAVTRCSRTVRQCFLFRGIVPLLYTEKPHQDYITDVDLRVKYALLVCKKMELVAMGDSVVVISPWKDGTGFTNNMRIAYAFFEHESIDSMLSRSTKISQKISRMMN